MPDIDKLNYEELVVLYYQLTDEIQNIIETKLGFEAKNISISNL